MLDFLDEKHEEAFYAYLDLDRTTPGDREREALFYIIAGTQDTRKAVHMIYDFAERVINPEALKGEYSSATLSLLELAFNLYNNYRSDSHGADRQRTILETFSNLDERNKKLAIHAIQARFPT